MFPDAHRVRTQEPHRLSAARRTRPRRRPHRRRRPLPRRGGLRQVRGPVSYPTAQADLRRVRRRGGRAHPRAVHKDFDPRGDAMTNDEIRAFIENAIKENSVMLFMKGTPNQPACGFSARTSGALNALGVQYAALDILPDPRIREELSEVSDWPTIPQLFVDGELVGGSDIMIEMYENGELAKLLGVEQPPEEEAPEPPSAEAPQSAPLGLENRLQ